MTEIAITVRIEDSPNGLSQVELTEWIVQACNKHPTQRDAAEARALGILDEHQLSAVIKSELELSREKSAVTHRYPEGHSNRMPCCGVRVLLGERAADRMTLDPALVTCKP